MTFKNLQVATYELETTGRHACNYNRRNNVNNVTVEVKKPHLKWTKLITDDCTVMGIDFNEISTVGQDRKGFQRSTYSGGGPQGVQPALQVRPTAGKSVTNYYSRKR